MSVLQGQQMVEGSGCCEDGGTEFSLTMMLFCFGCLDTVSSQQSPRLQWLFSMNERPTACSIINSNRSVFNYSF